VAERDARLPGLIFVALLAWGLWLAWRNLRDALRHPAPRPYAQGAIFGALLGWLLGR